MYKSLSEIAAKPGRCMTSWKRIVWKVLSESIVCDEANPAPNTFHVSILHSRLKE
jgi:hypothetical protein